MTVNSHECARRVHALPRRVHAVVAAPVAVRQTLGMRGNPSFGRRVRVTTTARRRGGTTTTRLLRVMFFDVRRFSFFTSVSTFLRFRLRERQIFCQCDDVAENPGSRHRGAGSRTSNDQRCRPSRGTVTGRFDFENVIKLLQSFSYNRSVRSRMRYGCEERRRRVFCGRFRRRGPQSAPGRLERGAEGEQHGDEWRKR